MKRCHLIGKSPSGIILLVVLAMLFLLCSEPANAASEPGTVTIVVGGEPENLDPGNIPVANVGPVLSKNIVESLTEMDPADSSIRPHLAQSWKQIDARTWQFSLRKGVKFHDGEDLNADAVIFSIKRVYEKRIASRVRDRFFFAVKLEGKALDSHTVEIKTDVPEPLMLTKLGYLPLCSPNTPLDKLTNTPIGTGPYKLAKWDKGVQIVYDRFEGYWGKKPQVKKAVYQWRSESSVRASMVLLGEADLAVDIAQQDATRPDMDYSYLNSETSLLRIVAVTPPLDDKRVRMALNYAVDRNAIRGTILSKDVVPATQLIVPNIFGYNPDLKVWPYDPQKARQLVDEARKDGVPVDKEISLLGRIGWFPGDQELNEALMTMYRAVGLNVKVKMMEAGAFRPYLNKPFPPNAGPYLLLRLADNNKGDAAFTVFFNYHCQGSSSSMCDKVADDLIDRAQVATGEERRNLWRAAFKRIHEDFVPDVVLFHMVGYCRVGKRINYKPSLATTTEIPLAQITFK
jgi:peptide/nickel transport system substrate-binding protein